LGIVLKITDADNIQYDNSIYQRVQQIDVRDISTQVP